MDQISSLIEHFFEVAASGEDDGMIDQKEFYSVLGLSFLSLPSLLFSRLPLNQSLFSFVRVRAGVDKNPFFDRMFEVFDADNGACSRLPRCR